MKKYLVKVHPSAARLPREEQLAWRIADFAAHCGPLDADVIDMIACRIVDNAAVALAAINRKPVAAARAMALAHPRKGGATLFGLPARTRVDAEWAAWANATAVRELDFHDTFLAADYSHPGDSISPLVAVAQQMGLDGAALARGIAAAYEIHVALVKAISLHKYKKDHVAHLAPATTAGIGTMLGLPTEIIFQAINQAVHLAFSTRQSRKGEISSWKAYVPGFSGKLAIECIDRAMRGEAAPSPIYEGEDSVIAWMLGGPETSYEVVLPEPGESPRAILETYTKAHSAEYQAQALIDLAIELSGQIGDLSEVKDVLLETSHHTHYVIGTGANDPQKMDPEASRETLDHSIMYILAVALEDRKWHHVDSYTRERARRPSTVELWHKIRTVEDPAWTARYHDPNPAKRAFGGRLIVTMKDGRVITGERAVADAHPNGARPWTWPDYVGKFDGLTGEIIDSAERDAFLSAARDVANLPAGSLDALVPALPEGTVTPSRPTGEGIFDRGLDA
ncbi:MmgE/PrpD family protein [Chelativorans sp. SCAU2101]|uniref:MmgE/PrpD family protein n=1 Tax=Chelativorans petroleitrophicus TaxID=2975484 RepID=A0A9X3B918_9HYPH|nr:MmgE/PrpD family protein [Chelativorans petroleitrophicus]MCT8989721.1 MmgE/PrpD family protein [Chelativorans petroleitrophicus]